MSVHTIMELDAQWMCLYLKLFFLKRPLIATQSFLMHVSISRSSCFRSTLMWLLHTKDLLKTGRWFMVVRARLSFVASTVKPELDRCADCSGIVLKARRNYHVRCLLKQQRYPYHDENESFPVYDSMTLQTFMVWLIHSFS